MTDQSITMSDQSITNLCLNIQKHDEQNVSEDNDVR